MKRLLLVRHAKSDWANHELNDFDRPLNNRGNKNAPEMAGRLLKKGLIPQVLVSSPALRAITTAQYFAEILRPDGLPIIKRPEIYEASSSALLSVVNSLDNQHDFIALFGHNPGLTNFAVNLCNCDLYNMSTCGMILIQFPFDDWKMISYHTGDEEFYDFPKNVVNESSQEDD